MFTRARDMCRYIRVLVLFGVIGFAYSSGLGTTEKRHGRFLFDLLGYLHGLKIGKDYALQLTPVFIPTPIIVVPSHNQQQSVSIQKGTTEENYQEMGGTIQTISTSAKLIAATISPLNNEPDSLRQSPKREVGKPGGMGQLRQQTTETPNVTSTTPTILSNLAMITTEINSGKYPAAVNNNITINNLTITTESSKDNTNSNNTTNSFVGVNTNNTNASKVEETDWSQPVPYPGTNPNGQYGVPNAYPAATYDNTFLNQLELTTDAPTSNVLLPPNGDLRWQKFSTVKNSLGSAEGFRPLAGLYYDGFLHMPLIKKGGWSPNF